MLSYLERCWSVTWAHCFPAQTRNLWVILIVARFVKSFFHKIYYKTGKKRENSEKFVFFPCLLAFFYMSLFPFTFFFPLKQHRNSNGNLVGIYTVTVQTFYTERAHRKSICNQGKCIISKTKKWTPSFSLIEFGKVAFERSYRQKKKQTNGYNFISPPPCV